MSCLKRVNRDMHDIRAVRALRTSVAASAFDPHIDAAEPWRLRAMRGRLAALSQGRRAWID